MDQVNTVQLASEDAAISGLREQITSNAKHLFPEVVKGYRAEYAIEEPINTSDAFNIITFSDRSVVHYQNYVPVGHAVKAALAYGATDDTTAKTALLTLPEWFRLRAMRALLTLIEVLIESNARDLLRPEQKQLVAVMGEGGVVKGKVDVDLLGSDI